MKKNPTRLIVWAIAILIAARLTWLSIQHHMPTFDTATLAVFSLYGARAGADNVARSVTARKTGASR